MRILIDTNILFSAIYSKNSIPYQAFKKAVELPYQCLICEYCLDELRRIFRNKFPHMAKFAEDFITAVLPMVEVVRVSEDVYEEESKIRDVNDRPILRAAINAEADILLTGDKDFLESEIETPRIMKAAEFLALP